MLPQNRHVQLEALDEHRDNVMQHFQMYTKQLSRAYDNLVRPRKFVEGDLVLMAAVKHIRGLPLPKFATNWEVPFIVKEVHDSSYCLISKIEEVKPFKINNKWLKVYHV